MSFSSKVLEINQKLRNIIPVSKRNKHVSFFLVLLATCCDNFSVAVGITTLYSIMEKFNASSVLASWTISAYTLTLASFIMLAGKLTDILGPELVFISGVFLTGIFSLINAVITDQIIVLIVFRAFQGIFAAALIPSSFAIAGSYYQGKYLGYAFNALIICLTAIFGVAIILGGAFSLTNIGYKGAYYFVFAFAFFISIALYLTIYPIGRTEGHKDLSLKYLDYPGAALLVVGVLLVILGLTEGGVSWKKPSAYVPLVIGILIIIFAVLFEVVYITNYKEKVNKQIQELNDLKSSNKTSLQGFLKKEEDELNSINSNLSAESKLTKDWRYQVQILLPKEVFTIPSILQYIGATFTLFIAFMAFIVVMYDYYQFAVADSPLMASLKIVPISLGLVFGACINQEAIIYKIGMKHCLLFSQILGIGVTVWAWRQDLTEKHYYWKYGAFSQFLYGYAANLYFQIYINAILRRTPVHLQGVASGLLQTVAQVGISLGNSILSSILGDLTTPTNLAEQIALQNKLKNPFYLIMACHAISFIFIIFIKNQKSIESPEANDGGTVEEIVQEA